MTIKLMFRSLKWLLLWRLPANIWHAFLVSWCLLHAPYVSLCSTYESVLWWWEETDLEILTDLHVMSPPHPRIWKCCFWYAICLCVYLSFCMFVCMHVCMDVWMCASLAPERADRLNSNSRFKSLSVTGRRSVYINIPALKIGAFKWKSKHKMTIF
jgi:hypothetical protein